MAFPKAVSHRIRGPPQRPHAEAPLHASEADSTVDDCSGGAGAITLAPYVSTSISKYLERKGKYHGT
jgi:hypothetical protein